MRAKGSVFLPYIALGGLLLLLADGWFKLQRMQNSTEDSVKEVTALSTDSTTPVAAASVGSGRKGRFDEDRRAEVAARVEEIGLALAEGHDVTDASEENQDCQQYILYYKPPKTGSTAVTDAARWYVQTQGHSDYRCGLYSCGLYAQGVCDHRFRPKQLLGHLEAKFSTVQCLRDNNYFVVTSSRDPLDRWNSAYRYNFQHKANHYGIPWNTSYLEFISKFPPCVLLNYYDGQGRKCGDDTDARIEKIVSMVDEVIDLYLEDNSGDLYRKIEPFLAESNVSDLGNTTLEYPELDEDLNARLEAERKLYNALKEKSKETLAPGRKLCVQKLEQAEPEFIV